MERQKTFREFLHAIDRTAVDRTEKLERGITQECLLFRKSFPINFPIRKLLRFLSKYNPIKFNSQKTN